MRESDVNLKADFIDFAHDSKESFERVDDKIDELQIDVNNLTAKTAKTGNKVIEFEKLFTNSNKKKG